MKSVIATTLTLTLLLLMPAPAVLADDQEKAQKKVLEQQADERAAPVEAGKRRGHLGFDSLDIRQREGEGFEILVSGEPGSITRSPRPSSPAGFAGAVGLAFLSYDDR